MAGKLAATSGIAVTAEREVLRSQILQTLLEWDRESGRLEKSAADRVAGRGRRPPEGSREWELLVFEELQKAYDALAGRGE